MKTLREFITESASVKIRIPKEVINDVQAAIDAYKKNGGSATIKANNKNLKQVVYAAISILGDNADLNFIDMDAVTDMHCLFQGTELEHNKFNGDISKWNTSHVINMHNMFRSSNFNGDISNWDVSKVTDMSGMFSDSRYNGDISSWDVSKVTDMSTMFSNSEFNGDLSRWDVSSVINMKQMFCDNVKFEGKGELNDWDVSNVKDMEFMFFGAKSFNADISKWNTCNKAVIR